MIAFTTRRTFNLLNTETNTVTLTIETNEPKVSFTQDGSKILLISNLRFINLIDSYTGEVLNEMPITQFFKILEISKDDSKFLVAGSSISNDIKIYDLQTFELISSIQCRPNSIIDSVSFNSDGTKIIACSSGFINIYDTTTGQVLLSKHETQGISNSIFFTPTDDYIISKSMNGYIMANNSLTCEIEFYFGGITAGAKQISISPDGSCLLFYRSNFYTTRDYSIVLLDFNTQEVIFEFTINSDIFSLSFNSDGTKIIICCKDIRIFDLETRDYSFISEGHKATFACFQPEEFYTGLK